MLTEATSASENAEVFYGGVLRLLTEAELPFMIGGAWSLREYAGIARDTKDLDVFCTAGDFSRALQLLASAGFRTEVTDANWLGKAFDGDLMVDIIFSSGNHACPVDGTWLDHAREIDLFGCTVKLVPPEEVLWTKMLVQSRHRFDGADVAHILRRQGRELDWARLLQRMEPNWEILLAQLVSFRFVYPSERDAVPRWVMEELLERQRLQLDMPPSREPVCRGVLLSRVDYEVDYQEWDYKEM